jgi:hypothetical protein
MEAIYDWNEYCEMLQDLESDVFLPEEEEAYHLWLQRESERFDEERAADFATY